TPSSTVATDSESSDSSRPSTRESRGRGASGAPYRCGAAGRWDGGPAGCCGGSRESRPTRSARGHSQAAAGRGTRGWCEIGAAPLRGAVASRGRGDEPSGAAGGGSAAGDGLGCLGGGAEALWGGMVTLGGGERRVLEP